MNFLYLLIKAIPLAFTALLPVVNPLGTSIILLSLTSGADDSSRRTLAKRIGLNTVILLTGLLLGGSYLLAFFGISVPIVQAAGGLVLAAMGWKLLNQEESAEEAPVENRSEEKGGGSLMDLAFYPFTFPLTVGPGCVAVTLTLSAHFRQTSLIESVSVLTGAFLGILGIGFVMFFCFAYSRFLADRLGHSGTKVLLRLIAFIVVCIGAEISWNGISTLIRQLH